MRNGKFTGFLIGALLATLPGEILAAKKPLDQAEDEGINILLNPGFESGKANWTASGGSFTLATGTSALVGNRSAVFNASASGQRLSTTLRSTTANGVANLSGEQVRVYCKLKGTATDYVLQAWDGTTPLATRTIPAITAASGQIIGTSSFTMPASGSVGLSILSGSDAADLTVDNCLLGTSGLVDISQAQLYGTVKVTGCSGVFETASATFANTSSTPTGCTYATTGRVSAPALSPSQMALRLQGAPAGKYLFIYTGSYGKLNSANYEAVFRFSDGTNHGLEEAGVYGGSLSTQLSEFSGSIDYATAQSDVTIRVQCKADGTNFCGLYGTNANPGVIKVYYYPLDSQVAQKFDTVAWKVDALITGADPQLGTSAVSSWSPIEDSGLTMALVPGSLGAQIPCSSTNDSTGLTCSSGNESMGISFTPPAAGLVEVCANFRWNYQYTGGSSNSTSASFNVVQTPNNAQTISAAGQEVSNSYSGGASGSFPFGADQQDVCGDFNVEASKTTFRVFYKQAGSNMLASAVSATADYSIRWTIRPKNQQVPAPLVVNTLVSDYAGILKLESVEFDGGTAITNCTSSPCTIRQSTSGWVTSIARSGAGNYLLTRTAGSFSARPMCFCTVMQQGTGAGVACSLNYTTSTTVEVYSGSGTDTYGTVSCIGPR